jgi:hypothetical protein
MSIWELAFWHSRITLDMLIGSYFSFWNCTTPGIRTSFHSGAATADQQGRFSI